MMLNPIVKRCIRSQIVVAQHLKETGQRRAANQRRYVIKRLMALRHHDNASIVMQLAGGM